VSNTEKQEKKRKMAKSKDMTKKTAKRAGRANRRNVNEGVLGMPVAWPGSSAVAPGRATARMVTEVFSTVDRRAFSKNGFNVWSSQLAGLIAPYKYFRVCDCSAEVMIAGGAASTYSVAFNISNSYSTDTDLSDVLNDDYAGVATALIRPKLRPPKSYWATRPVNWYQISQEGDIGYSLALAQAGSVSLAGSGGATTTTVIGYLVVELTVEFHTLL